MRKSYDDEFDGTTLNTNDWVTYYPSFAPNAPYSPANYPDDRTREEGPVVFRDENVSVNNGHLTLQVKAEANPQTYGSKNGDFTGGLIYSTRKYEYGRFEIRCQMPRGTCGWMGQPLWSSFWLNGGNCGTAEIDILEINDSHHYQDWWEGLSYHSTWTADHATLYTSLHGQPYDSNPSLRNLPCSDCEGHSPHGLPSSYSRINNFKDPRMGSITNGYHIYSLEWEPSRITWLFDGVPVNRYYRYITQAGLPCGETSCESCIGNPLWPSSPLNIIAELKMGSQGIDGTAPLPAFYDIDYVRVYQRIPSDDPAHICGGNLTGETTVCGAGIYTANFRLPTTQINWTCSSNLVLSGTTGSSVTVSPTSSGLSEQGWIVAEPVEAV